LIAAGVYCLWAQHSGIPVRVEVLTCGKTAGCHALWQPTAGPQKRVWVVGGGNQGQPVDVHIHGSIAYANSLLTVIVPILFGILALGVGTRGLNATLRSAT
jgi:hypothetical protein